MGLIETIAADEVKSCDYCHESVSVYEGLTEYGKWFHEQCYIHRTQKEIEGYKKKWINKTMTDGDKVDLVDKFNLVQRLMVERTEFRGFVPISEYNRSTPVLVEKVALCIPNGEVLVDKNGFPILMETKTPSVTMKTLSMRPSVARVKTGFKPKLISVQDIPLLMESLP